MNIKGKYIALVVPTETYYFLNLIYKIENDNIYSLEHRDILENRNSLKIVVKGEEKYYLETKRLLDDNKIIQLNLPEIDDDNFFKLDSKFNENNLGSVKYFTYISNLNRKISKIDDNKIYQIIDCDNIIYDFKIFKHNKQNRKIKSIDLPDLVTKKIYIKYNGYLYGYFSYKEIDEFIEIENAGKELKNKIKIDNIQNCIIEVDDDYYNSNYSLICLENVDIKEQEDFVYIDDLIARVVNEIKKNSSSIKLTKSQISDLKSELKEIYTLGDYRKNLFEELTDEQINFLDVTDDLIEKILTNEDKLDEICQEVANNYYGYGEVAKKIENYNEDIKNKSIELESIKKQIKKEQEELERLKADRSKELEIKNTDQLDELKESIESANKELSDVKEKIALESEKLKKLDDEYDFYIGQVKKQTVTEKYENRRKLAEQYTIKAEKELSNIKEEIKIYEDKKSQKYSEMLDEAIENIEKSYKDSNFNSFAVNNILKISSEYQNKKYIDVLQNNVENQYKYKNIEYQNEKEIINHIQKFILEKAKRNISFNDVANIVICIAQGFLTVFAGEPGTGKTSLCNILGKSMGLCNENDSRYIEVSVEKGWTSKSDFIGYFNPLTKTFDSNNKKLYEAFLKLDVEEKLIKKEDSNFNKQYPYFILLDEANLSPMEHYWADFMNVCDLGLEQEHYINLGEGNECKVSNALRFLATINYDHTTEVLSPRLIDRAWIILLEYKNEIKISELLDVVIKNNEEVLDLDGLKLFMNNENNHISKTIEQRLGNIIQIFRNYNINISPRVLKMIKNYCAVADNILDKENALTTLDYAVSQKILPLIDGYGMRYKEFLEELMAQLKGMNKCQRIIMSILDREDKNMGHYSFFSR